LALGAGGSFRTLEPTPHCRTQALMLQLFLGASVHMAQETDDAWRIDVTP
jgi:hypothetical protein